MCHHCQRLVAPKEDIPCSCLSLCTTQPLVTPSLLLAQPPLNLTHLSSLPISLQPKQGCNRSFAELWRLKVHFRAPPDVRGSGKERGHGQELQYCPKCGQELKPGKHHVGCLAGRSAPRQAAKRQKHSTTDTSDMGGGATSDPSSRGSDPSSWEDSYRRKQEHLAATAASRRRRAAAAAGGGNVGGTGAFGYDSSSGGTSTAAAAADGVADGAGDEGPELVFTKHHNGPVDFGLLLNPPAPFLSATNYSNQQPPFPGSINPYRPFDSAVETGGGIEAGGATTSYHHNQQQQQQQQQDPFNMKYDYAAFHFGAGLDDDDAEEDYLARGIPSPPPLPPDWDDLPHNGTAAAGGNDGGGGDNGGLGLLFDFDQFDTSVRAAASKTPIPSFAASHAGGGGVPLVTISTAMNPSELSNPSENYVWQIMFAGESDHVPKRVTAHLHNREPHPMVMPQFRAMMMGDDGDGAAAGNGNGVGGNGGGGGQRALQPTPEELPLDFLLHREDSKVKNNNNGALEMVLNGGDPQQQQQQLQVDIPPPPKEVMQAVVEQQAAQKVTVTYTVSPGEAGKPTYTVDNVQRINSNGVCPLHAAAAAAGANGTGH